MTSRIAITGISVCVAIAGGDRFGGGGGWGGRFGGGGGFGGGGFGGGGFRGGCRR